MAIEHTFAIIKPDAVAAGHTGKIIDLIESNGFTVANMKKVTLTRAQAEGFYHVHAARPFFGELCDFMTSGPCVVMILAKEGAVLAWRDLMGATDPKKAAAGTVRALFGTSIGSNASHGSDAPETAAFETQYFFSCFERL
jgi:nucleoside-diphosphate kinase